ncbi:MlaD family protein [Hymenobacter antarcticus]|uniref:Mce/MlaD domain-containing protein n=1 Tax=Hymenobacter antarcticus TaxID=486270 RepID=A0ABP7PTI9_9BACT
MPQRPASNHVRLGLFVLVGVAFLLVTLFLLGRQQNLFSHSLVVQADFRNVSGLLTGNNVRLGGIPVGTVRKIQILNDTTVRVAMNLNRDVQPFVRKNAVATIGTDGLVGNTIINLVAAPGPAPAVVAGDVLRTKVPVGIDAILGTLDVSNKNLVGITLNLREITGKLNHSASVWKLLNDEQLPINVRHSLRNVEEATAKLDAASTDVLALTHGVRRGRGPAGYLFTDTAFGGRLGHAARQLAGTSDTLAATISTLKQKLRTEKGPLNTLLADTAFSRDMRQSMQNVNEGTRGFSQNMEALKHNFLLRGHFRRQQKKEARAALERSGRGAQ